MKAAFWTAVGVAATVIVYRRGRRLRAQLAPHAVVGRAATTIGEARGRATAARQAFGETFTAARAAREAELIAALLAPGQPNPDSH